MRWVGRLSLDASYLQLVVLLAVAPLAVVMLFSAIEDADNLGSFDFFEHLGRDGCAAHERLANLNLAFVAYRKDFADRQILAGLSACKFSKKNGVLGNSVLFATKFDNGLHG